MRADGRDHGAGREIEQVEDEVVGMLGLDTIRLEAVRRKVLQVEGNDGLRARANRGSEDMPVIRIGEHEAGDQLVEPVDHTIGDGPNHQLACARKLLPGEVGTLLEDAPEALVENGL